VKNLATNKDFIENAPVAVGFVNDFI